MDSEEILSLAEERVFNFLNFCNLDESHPSYQPRHELEAKLLSDIKELKFLAINAKGNKRRKTVSPDKKYYQYDLDKLKTEVEEEKISKERAIQKLKKKVSELQGENRQLASNLERLYSREQDALVELENEQQNWLNDKSSLKRENDENKAKILSLQQQVNDLLNRPSEVPKIENELNENSKERANLADQKLKSAEEKISGLNLELEKSRFDLKSAEVEIESFKLGKMCLKTGENVQEKLEESLAKEREQRAEMKELEKRIKSQIISIDEMKLGQGKVASYMRDLVELQSSFAKQGAELKGAKSYIADREAFFQSSKEWKADFSNAMKKLGIFSSEESNPSPVEIARKIQSLQQSSAALKLSLSNCEAKLSKVSEDFSAEQKKCEKLEAEKENTVKRIAKLNASLKLARELVGIKENELVSMREVVNSFVQDEEKYKDQNVAVLLSKMNEKSNKAIKDALESFSLIQTQPKESPGNSGASKKLKKELEERTKERDHALSVVEEKERELARNVYKVAVGDFDSSELKVVHMSQNPNAMAISRKIQEEVQKEVEMIKKENLSLKQSLKGLMEGNDTSVDSSVLSLTQGINNETRYQRLKEVYAQKSKVFREAVFALLGYKVDLTTEREFTILKLRCMYAEKEDDVLVFQWVNGVPELLASEFANCHTDKIRTYLNACHSFPAFLSSITLEQFEKRTFNPAS